MNLLITAVLLFAEAASTPSHKEANFPDSVRIELLTLKSQISDIVQFKAQIKEEFEKLNTEYDQKLKDLREKYAKREKELTPDGFKMDRTLMVLVPDKTDAPSATEKEK